MSVLKTSKRVNDDYKFTADDVMSAVYFPNNNSINNFLVITKWTKYGWVEKCHNAARLFIKSEKLAQAADEFSKATECSC